MARFSAIANVTRNEDGVLRDIPLRETAGDWALPSLPLRLATTAVPAAPDGALASVRPNWRKDTRLPHVSAADLLTGKAVCREAAAGVPALGGRVALVGHTASGLNDAKPTSVDPVMPGVGVLAEATEALVAGSGIRTPPGWLKYVLATFLVLLTTYAFYRGEPANDIDSVFVAGNLTLLTAAFVGITFFGFFFDIFAAIGFVGLIFGFCRGYAGLQRGRAVGNGDFLVEYNPQMDRWLAIARLRFVLDAEHGAAPAARQRREYRRRLRRFLYAGSDAVVLEGVVERKSWLHDALSDLMVLVWHGPSPAAARAAAGHDLARLERELARYDARLPDDGSVRLAFACAETAANMRVLMGGKAGKGRVTETAGVRGIEENDLKAASFDRAQLDGMVAQRVDAPTAEAFAGEHGWQATGVAYADEARRGKSTGESAADAGASKAKAARAVSGLLGSLGVNSGSLLDDVAKVVPKSEDELAAEELARGPEIAGRILGVRPLWNDAAAQRRVNLVGRWVASQTSRPDLPWTFGVIDTPEVNAFAAPGGYILVTRGLYELVSTDSELAAAIAHEISHCVQRDHYNVIHKQEMADTARERALSQVTTGTDTTAGRYARR